jgi:hypothetical protein
VSDLDFTINNTLVPAAVSLLISVTLLSLNNVQNKKAKFQDDVQVLCDEVLRAIHRTTPSLHEEDFLYGVTSLKGHIKRSNLVKQSDMQKICSDLVNIKHLFPDLTNDQTTPFEREKVIEKINTMISNLLVITGRVKVFYLL